MREYFAKQLREREPESYREAHSRLFDHLCEATKHRPDTLDGLQPLYQAVVHGCLAERHEEARANVYRDRILRGTGNDGNYSMKKLGAIGADLAAVAAFFDQPFSRLSPNLSEPDQAWLLNEAALRLRALGRLTEALEPMRVSGEMDVAVEEWKGAAISYSNLSELEVTLGRLESAVADARRAIDLADRSDDEFWQMGTRTAAADALHQFGDCDEARGLFEEAERLQQQSQPEFNLLYSLRGFQYCDLLLAPSERAAWNRLTACPTGRASADPPSPLGMGLNEDDRAALLAACTEVERRATQTLEWVKTQDWLLDIALDHLTQARATLYRELHSAEFELRTAESESPDSPFPVPPSDLNHAVNGLRQAGRIDHLPNGLLTAAIYHVLCGDAAAAIRDLDEALQIAERGPMPLYAADILLTRARLFGAYKHEAQASESRDDATHSLARRACMDYPWTESSPPADLAEARRLIEQHHYHRRLAELEDAEHAILV